MIQKENVRCIICDKENNATSIEHIVSEAFGNKSYVAPQGIVCDECNNKFSKFEGVALSNSVFIMERARYGIATKRGKNAKGKVDNLEIQGHDEFEKNRITVKGLTPDNFKSFNPTNGTAELFIKSFDRSEVACSKLLLKMALPAIFVSQNELFQKCDFTDLKEFLTNKNTYDWPFVTSNFDITKFASIPTFTDKYNLKRIRCSLKYCEFNDQALLFKFTYGGISMVINLLNRSLDWAAQYINSDSQAVLYPEHFRKKMQVVK